MPRYFYTIYSTHMKNMLLVSNWKTYVSSLKQTHALLNIPYPKNVTHIPCLPTAFLSEGKTAQATNPYLGAQTIDIPKEHGGSPTGMTTPHMLKNLGVTHCIVGHAEQRTAGETNEHICIKMNILLQKNIVPIVCVGSNNKNTQQRTIKKQLEILKKIAKKTYIIAYEPLYAIGGASPASNDDIKKIVAYIRTCVPHKTPVLYGGSVSGKHAQDIYMHCEVDGFLVGRASTSVSEFKKLLRYV